MTDVGEHRADLILVAFNRAHLLANTIDSVLAQTHNNFTLTVCDDASTDETQAVARAYADADHRVNYVRNLRNMGMPENLIGGIRRTTAPFIACLHDGDTYAPQMLDAWIRALVLCERAAFVFNAYSSSGATTESGTYREVLPACFPGSLLLEHIYFRRWRFDSPVWGTTLFRRSMYDAVGGLKREWGFYADVDLWLRLAEESDVAYVPDPLINLIPREVAPRLFDSSGESKIAGRIILAARRRHYSDRPLRRTAEEVRHQAFRLSNALYAGLLSIKHMQMPPRVGR